MYKKMNIAIEKDDMACRSPALKHKAIFKNAPIKEKDQW